MYIVLLGMLGRFMLFRSLVRLGNVGAPRKRDLLMCVCMCVTYSLVRLRLFCFRRRLLFFLLEIVGALLIRDLFTATRLRARPSGVLLFSLFHLHIVLPSLHF